MYSTLTNETEYYHSINHPEFKEFKVSIRSLAQSKRRAVCSCLKVLNQNTKLDNISRSDKALKFSFTTTPLILLVMMKKLKSERFEVDQELTEPYSNNHPFKLDLYLKF